MTRTVFGQRVVLVLLAVCKDVEDGTKDIMFGTRTIHLLALLAPPVSEGLVHKGVTFHKDPSGCERLG